LLHLLQAFKQRNMSACGAENPQQQAAETQRQHRIFQAVHQRMQPRQAPDGHHSYGNGDKRHDSAAEDINEMHLRINGDGQREMGMEEQIGRQGARRRQQGSEQPVPQRHIVTAVEGLRKNNAAATGVPNSAPIVPEAARMVQSSELTRGNR
jgi:hypothetical protein